MAYKSQKCACLRIRMFLRYPMAWVNDDRALLDGLAVFIANNEGIEMANQLSDDHFRKSAQRAALDYKLDAELRDAETHLALVRYEARTGNVLFDRELSRSEVNNEMD